MRPELEDHFSEKYSKLFKNKTAQSTQTPIFCGCECGDGWYKILDHLFGYLIELTNTKFDVDFTKEYKDLHRDKKDFYKEYSSYKFSPPQILLDQVKEKYGTLRVYHHSEFEDIPEDIWAILDIKQFYKKMEDFNQRVENAIDYAEYQSSRTCEITGAEGKLYTEGWHRVLSDEEAVKAGYYPEHLK